MVKDGIPSDLGPAGARPVRASRSTPDLLVELQWWARALSVAAIAVADRNRTRFVFVTDDDPLGTLNALIGAGGHPTGLVGARIGDGTVEYHARPLVECQHNPHAVAYLETLRILFLTLLRTHVERMPDNPRWK